MKNMKYRPVILVALFLVSVFFLWFFVCKNNLKKVKIGNVEFETEVASTLKERATGLSGRSNLCENCAMLFIFPQEGEYGFWMKNMKFDLDIIWIREDRIVKIAKDISRNDLKTIDPKIMADKVLEINAGLAEKYGFREGDRIIAE